VNNDRRKKLDAAMNDVETLKARMEELKELFDAIKGEADDVKSVIDGIKDDEQSYYDAMPESLQSSDKGQNAEAAVSQMEDAMNTLDEVIDADLPEVDLDVVITALDEAKA
jgi:uncharacterized coiled-coil DUF342 family protein